MRLPQVSAKIAPVLVVADEHPRPVVGLRYMLRFREMMIVWVALIVLPNAVRGQSLQTITPQQCVWHAGDDLNWASPSLDERAWLPWPQWNAASPEPQIWIRCHADLSSLRGTSSPALQITLYAAYEVYLNGRLVGSDGNLRRGDFTMNIIREWPISVDLVSPAVIALRITRRVASEVPVGPAPQLQMFAANSDLLKNRRSDQILTRVASRIFSTVCFCIIGVLAIVLLPLWFNDRSRRELLLLSGSCAAVPFIYLDYMAAAALFSLPVSGYFLMWAVPAAAANITRVLFPFALARRRVPVVLWILIIMGNAFYLPVMIVPLLPAAQALALDGLRSRPMEAIGDVFRFLETLASLAAFLPWSGVPSRMKPLAALTITWGSIMMVFFAVRFTGTHIPGIPDLQQHWGTTISNGEAVAILSLMIALLFLLFREQLQTSRERAILAGEMQAAQQVQRLLAPESICALDGLRLEVEFLPVGEVGGDFYSCCILPGNRQRILLGDVSGKGAAAAMTAAVLLGAAQRRDHDHPAELLDHLNRVLVDMRLGGFATCFCAEISQGGSLIIANAGHLAPYHNGREVPLESRLPLGISATTEYTEATLPLVCGDRLTFLSDGVVEAQNTQGELFGFERTQAISARSAHEIASAAQAHGQQDDITVLTLTFGPAEAGQA